MENKILRSRLGTEVHTRPEERQRLLEFGKVLGRAIEELITIVSVSTFFRWCRDEKAGKKTPNPKGGPAQAARDSGAGQRDRKGHWLRLHPHHRRIEKTWDQRDQPSDGAEHPQGRRHPAGTGSHVG